MNRQRFIGCLWLGLLLAAAVFCIAWGRTPTKDAQAFLGFSASATPLPVVTAEVPYARATPDAPFFTAPPTPSPAPTPIPTDTPDPAPFSLIWYSDTQYYAYKHPEIFRSMAEWTLDNAETLGCVAVVHTGDIVDNHNYERHWRNASSAISMLKGKLPFYCVAGNHDVGAESIDYAMYQSYGYCDVKEPRQLYENGVAWVQPIPEKRLLLVGVGWQKGTPYLDWIKAKLHEYADYSAVLLVHSFLEDNGTLTANGKLLEKSLLPDAKNLRLILCGHKDGSVRWQKTYDDNTRTVNAVMYNFQDDKQKGLGYLRILTFDPVSRSIHVSTYSPYLDDYNYYQEESLDSFTLYNAY